LPHFEKVTQIKTDNAVVTAIGGHYGVNYARKKAVARQSRSRYRNAGRKEKSAILDEFISITGYKKLEVRPATLQNTGTDTNTPLREKHGRQTQTRQTKAPKPEGQKIYTDEVIASLRLIWVFFWYKCGKLLAPLMRRQMDYIALS
jgi:hypothetical protein